MKVQGCKNGNNKVLQKLNKDVFKSSYMKTMLDFILFFSHTEFLASPGECRMLGMGHKMKGTETPSCLAHSLGMGRCPFL